GTVAAELHERYAPRLHQRALQTSGSASYGKAGERLIRRTAVGRTRMPGGVGGGAPGGVPPPRLTGLATQPYSATEVDGWQYKPGVSKPGRSTQAADDLDHA